MNALHLALLLPFLLVVTSLGLATQTFGNKPLGDANYGDWPGIISVVNQPSRVLHIWVNGNENFYYDAKIGDINQMLADLAKVKRETREVLLRPGKGKASNLGQDKEFATTAELRLIGGIAGGMAREDKGKVFWSTHPRLTIYTEGLDLDKLVIPKGLTVLQVEDLSKRYRDALDSKSQTVRGWGAGMLAELDAHNPKNMHRVARLLADEEEWVVRCAAGALKTYGKAATECLPMLEDHSMSEDKNLRDAVVKAMTEIKSAPDRSEEAKKIRAQLEAIRKRLSESE